MRNKALVILTAVFLADAVAAENGPPREALWKDVSERRARLQTAEEQLLAPDSRDVAAFASLLAQPDTGLVRLLPREKGERALALRGGGAYYSFSRRTHEYGLGSDIGLSNGALSTGFAGADFGFFEEAEGLPLETLTSEHPAAANLAAFETPTTLEGARKAQSAAARAAERPRPLREATVVVDRCYFLRSVNYRTSDVLVAFRVVRADDDDSVTLLWKILKRFPIPELKD